MPQEHGGFPKQSVSLTEGLFVKENTGMDLSSSGEHGGGRRSAWGRGEGGRRGKMRARLRRFGCEVRSVQGTGRGDE